MIETISKIYRRGLVQWTGVVTRFAWVIVLVSVLLSVGAAVYLAENIRINTDTGDMLSPDLDYRRNGKELSKAFPQFSDNLVIVIDGQTPDAADDAARALTERFRAQPKKYGQVDDPAGSDFFRRNGFLYLDLDELYALSDRLAEAQPFLGVLWRDPSLVGFLKMLGLAVDEAAKEQGGQPIEIASVLGAMDDVARAQALGQWKDMSWQALMSGPPPEGEEVIANRRVLVIKPVLDYGTLAPAASAMDSVREAAKDLGLTPKNGVRVRLTGSAALAHEELQSVKEGMGLAGIVSLILVIGLLVIGLRSKRMVAATLVTLVMGLVWTAAFAILALGTLNLISVAFAVLFIGLSVDFGIHYGLRYREGLDAGRHHAEALSEAAANAGGALTLCAVSAAIAFYSFLPTDYLGLAELGLIAGTGMFIALFANVTVLPAVLTVLPPLLRQSRMEPHVDRLSTVQPFIRTHCRAISLAALAVGVAASLSLPWATFDFDPMNLRDPKTESVATIFDLMADKRSNPYSLTILSRNLDEAITVGEKLKGLDLVKGTATLADYVPADQPEKLEVISSMALFLGPAFASAGTAREPSAEDLSQALTKARIKLRALADRPGGSAESKAAGALLQTLSGMFEVLAGRGLDQHTILKEYEARLLRALPGRLKTLNMALGAGPVTLENLPAEIRGNQIAADGRAMLEVYAKENLHDRAALTRFVAAVRTIAPQAAGSSVGILEGGRTVVGAFWLAGAISLTLISLILIVVLKRLVNAALVLAPLALAAVLTVAVSTVFGLAFNFANIIVLPLLFGLGVAGGIHLVVREREKGEEGGAFDSSTPRAILFSALTTIGSFGSIALSSHPGTSSMGLLLTVAITLSLVCTLVVLPALMEVVHQATSENIDNA
ncbi:MAG: MMPL family transporter [Rhodospirillales bacterium]|nr:MMPL family transporter [Rhodospirillales bacterium]